MDSESRVAIRESHDFIRVTKQAVIVQVDHSNIRSCWTREEDTQRTAPDIYASLCDVSVICDR